MCDRNCFYLAIARRHAQSQIDHKNYELMTLTDEMSHHYSSRYFDDTRRSIEEVSHIVLFAWKD
jgi:hypothetical protein